MVSTVQHTMFRRLKYVREATPVLGTDVARRVANKRSSDLRLVTQDAKLASPQMNELPIHQLSKRHYTIDNRRHSEKNTDLMNFITSAPAVLARKKHKL